MPRPLSQYRQDQQDKLGILPASDWAILRNDAIADQLQISERVVHEYRMDNCLPKQPRKTGSGRPIKYAWEKFDPSVSDEDNAFLLNAPLYYIRWYRRHKINPSNKTRK